MDDFSKEIRGTYNKIASSYSEKYDYQNHAHPLLDSFIQKLHASSLNIADLGCGTGRTSGYILNKIPEAQIVGYDFSEAMVAIAKKHYPNITFNLSDLTEIDLEFENFDAAIAQSVIFHLTKEQFFVLASRVHQALRSGGIFSILMQVVNEYHCTAVTEPLNHDLRMGMCFYSEEVLQEGLLSAGFRNIEVERVPLANSDISDFEVLITCKK